MKHCILLLAVVCAGASFTCLGGTKENLTFFSAAKEAVSGVNWASQMCNTADWLCHSWLSLALAAAGLWDPMLPDTGERYLSTPLFGDIPADMNEEEIAISRSTPAAQMVA